MQKLQLRANPDFFEGSAIIRSRALSLYMKRNTLKKSRFAVVVPKKIVSLATKRNALKRRIFAHLQKHDLSLLSRDVVVRVIDKRLLDEKMKIDYEIKSIIDKANLGV